MSKTNIFHRAIVLLDRLAPHQGAFPHALDWARQLRLVVQGVWVPELEPSPATMTETGEAVTREKGHVEQMCAGTCARAGVCWEGFCGRRCLGEVLRKIATPENLLVFDEALPSASKKELTRVACGKRVSAVLACPRTWVPLERVLVVDQAGSLNEPFLRNAMTLCGHLRAVPIVLTLAHSERAAILRREAICAALKDWGVEARLDFIVGARIGSAVTSVARVAALPTHSHPSARQSVLVALAAPGEAVVADERARFPGLPLPRRHASGNRRAPGPAASSTPDFGRGCKIFPMGITGWFAAYPQAMSGGRLAMRLL